MSYSSRLFIVTLGGCLVGAWILPLTQRHETYAQHANRNQEDTGSDAEIVRDRASLRSIFEEAIKIYRDEKAAADQSDQRKEEREERNSTAQIGSTDWAQRSFWVSFAQLPIGALTLWFLLKTFRETKRTADAGIKAANAAEAGVELASDTARRQLRAYLSIEITGFHFNRDPNRTLVCIANFRIRNDGQTPAYDVRTNVDFCISEQPLIRDLGRPRDNILRYENTISPNRFQEASGTKAISIDQQKLLPGQKLYFIGLILYKDAFGSDQETWFCGYIDQSELIMDSSPGPKTIPITFRWAERHNKTT
ncbi:hypothetical protein HUU61_01060 [Rhodopseudomonas palustris]|nr:hypothetical protein [Rhodopseudomonas palustris]